MASRRLTPKYKKAEAKRSLEIGSGDTADDARWLFSEIWKNPWIDFDALITARLNALRVKVERRGKQESNWFYTDLLSVEFSFEFDRICVLIRDAMTDDTLPADPKTIQLNLSEIVYRHRNRHSRNSKYFDRIRGSVEAAEAAADQMDKMVDLLINMDPVQTDQFMFTVNKLSLGRYGEMLGEFARSVLKAQLTMHLFSRALQISTMEPVALQAKRGRPRVPYVAAAFDLARLWEVLTGQNAVYPKGSAKGKGGQHEAVQPSTEFIRLAFKMIDPDITVAQVITSLKYVFDINKSMGNGSYTREYLIPPPIMDIIRAGGSGDDVEKAFMEYGKEIARRINSGKSD